MKGGNFVRGRLLLSLNKDPHTPVMVYLHQGGERASATFECALTEGEVDGFALTAAECSWLDSFSKEATEWWDAHRDHNA